MRQVDTKKGPDPCNTAPSSSQNGGGGPDWLELGLGVRWSLEALPMFQELEAAKVKAQADREPVCIELGGAVVVVSSAGMGKGFGHYHYAFETGGVRWGMRPDVEPLGETDNVRVVVGSLECMRAGSLSNLRKSIWDMVSTLGGKVLFNRVSRVDFCIDLPDVDTHDLVTSIVAGKCIRYASKSQFFQDGERFTGVRVGSDSLSLNVYDKELESRAGDIEKRAFLVAERWGGHVETATRIEFRLRREALTGMLFRGGDELGDLIQKQAMVVTYLVRDWFRITGEVVDRANNNQSRAVVSSLWAGVQALAERVYGAGEAIKRVKRAGVVDVQALMRQATGCIVAAFMYKTGGFTTTATHFLADALEELRGVVSDPDALERFGERALTRAARVWSIEAPSRYPGGQLFAEASCYA